MAISRSDMSAFISHVLEKRYEVALQYLQSMLSSSEPGRYLMASKEAFAMIRAVGANFSKAARDFKPADSEYIFQLLQFLTACYTITGDAEAFDRIAQFTRINSPDFGANRQHRDKKAQADRSLVAEATYEKLIAMRLEDNQTVQVQALELLLNKQSPREASNKKRHYSDTTSTATDRYLAGIKRRNIHRLKQVSKSNYTP